MRNALFLVLTCLAMICSGLLLYFSAEPVVICLFQGNGDILSILIGLVCLIIPIVALISNISISIKWNRADERDKSKIGLAIIFNLLAGGVAGYILGISRDIISLIVFEIVFGVAALYLIIDSCVRR